MSITNNAINVINPVGQDGNATYHLEGGSGNAFFVAVSPTPPSLNTGMVIRFKATHANSTAATLNLNGFGAVPMKKFFNQDLEANDIVIGQIVTVSYDGTNWQVQSVLALNTGTGALARATSPTFVTPVLGAAAATSINFGGSTLSIYATGTWTPILVSDGGGTATYQTNAGTYTRIDSLVLFQITLLLTGLPAAGNLSISGLPFTVGTVYSGGSMFNNVVQATVTSPVEWISAPGTTQLLLYYFTAGNSNPLQTSNCGVNSQFIFGGLYYV